jgi:hypothetical protein
VIVAGFLEGARGYICLLAEDGELKNGVLPVVEPADMRFLWGRESLVIADRAADAIYLVRDPAGTAVSITLADASHGLRRPVKLGVGYDQRYVTVLQEGSSELLVVGIESRSIQRVQCSCRPETLQPLKGPSVFQLTINDNRAFVGVSVNRGRPEVFSISAAPDLPEATSGWERWFPGRSGDAGVEPRQRPERGTRMPGQGGEK